MRTALTPAAAVLAACAAAACSFFRPPAGGIPEEGTAGGADACSRAAMIDDADDGDDQILLREGRGGYLYTFVDETGSTVWPGDDAFAVSAAGGGRAGTALRVKGALSAGAEVYAGLGLAFVEPVGPYDASRYTGIAFLARRAPGTQARVRVSVADANSAPEAGICKECDNNFGVSFEMAEQWTRYEVAFAQLTQESGWGDPRPPALDRTRLYGIQWQVAQTGQKFDFWIDDVSFIGCPGGGASEVAP
jgi:hypothetical protein